jgi:hypothetical protein
MTTLGAVDSPCADNRIRQRPFVRGAEDHVRLVQLTVARQKLVQGRVEHVRVREIPLRTQRAGVVWEPREASQHGVDL